jgi:hypothetical protein
MSEYKTGRALHPLNLFRADTNLVLMLIETSFGTNIQTKEGVCECLNF